jgi:hypothetical protein
MVDLAFIVWLYRLFKLVPLSIYPALVNFQGKQRMNLIV